MLLTASSCQESAACLWNDPKRHAVHKRLDLDFALGTILLLLLACLSLGAHDPTAPVATALLVLVGVALLDGRDDLGQLGLVFAADFGDGESGGGLDRYVSGIRPC